MRPLIGESRVPLPVPIGGASRTPQHLDRRRAGLVERPPSIFAVPVLQPRQRERLAIETAGALEALGADHHPKLTDLHRLPPRSQAAGGDSAPPKRSMRGGKDYHTSPHIRHPAVAPRQEGVG